MGRGCVESAPRTINNTSRGLAARAIAARIRSACAAVFACRRSRPRDARVRHGSKSSKLWASRSWSASSLLSSSCALSESSAAAASLALPAESAATSDSIPTPRHAAPSPPSHTPLWCVFSSLSLPSSGRSRLGLSCVSLLPCRE
eukprot:scaffold191219_cov37-Tisochrysis_lutea.AAC.1